MMVRARPRRRWTTRFGRWTSSKRRGATLLRTGFSWRLAQSLGRNLGACGSAVTCNATATVTLVEPNTMFEKRLNQLDIRLNKLVKLGRARLQGMFDVYNVFNDNAVLQVQTRYGPTWLRPNRVLGARLFKFGAQLDF